MAGGLARHSAAVILRSYFAHALSSCEGRKGVTSHARFQRAGNTWGPTLRRSLAACASTKRPSLATCSAAYMKRARGACVAWHAEGEIA